MNELQGYILNHLEYFVKVKDVFELEYILDKINESLKECPKWLKINNEHYKKSKVETIELIKDITKDSFIGYCVGNVIKYICRYPYKHKETTNQYMDLCKAKWYVEYLIKYLSS